MVEGFIEPLEATIWSEEILKLIDRCYRPNARHNQEALLRTAFYLLQLSPEPLRRALSPTIGETDFETLLESGNFEQAAGMLFPMAGEPAFASDDRPAPAGKAKRHCAATPSAVADAPALAIVTERAGKMVTMVERPRLN
jgi:hypothetical protein